MIRSDCQLLLLIYSAGSHGIEYTDRYNFLHNDHGNEYHSVSTKEETKEKVNYSIHLNFSRLLNGVESTTDHKNKLLLWY